MDSFFDFLIGSGLFILIIFSLAMRFIAALSRKSKQAAKEQQHTLAEDVEHQYEHMDMPRQQERPRKKRRPSFQEILNDLMNQPQQPQQQKQRQAQPQPIFEEGQRSTPRHEAQKKTRQAEEWKGVEGLTETQKLFIYSEIIKPKYEDDTL